MGYVHDTHFAQFIPPTAFSIPAGTWTPSVASDVFKNVRTAGAAAFTAYIPIPIPSNASAYKGCRLKSIDVFYKILTKDTTDFALATIVLSKFTLPATAVAPTGAAVVVTNDSAHDTAAKLKAQGDHTLTLTLTTPAWIANTDAYVLTLVVDAADTSVFTFFGARANYDLRA